MNVVWTALTLVGARCSQVWSDLQAQRSQTIQDMVNILYDKTDDAQEGVVSVCVCVCVCVCEGGGQPDHPGHV